MSAAMPPDALQRAMMIEITPRKFEGDWVEPHRTAVTANLHRALDALA